LGAAVKALVSALATPEAAPKGALAEFVAACDQSELVRL
jgi:hypothetical protein